MFKPMFRYMRVGEIMYNSMLRLLGRILGLGDFCYLAALIWEVR